jgi:hypothetical protein
MLGGKHPNSMLRQKGAQHKSDHGTPNGSSPIKSAHGRLPLKSLRENISPVTAKKEMSVAGISCRVA